MDCTLSPRGRIYQVLNHRAVSVRHVKNGHQLGSDHHATSGHRENDYHELSDRRVSTVRLQIHRASGDVPPRVHARTGRASMENYAGILHSHILDLHASSARVQT